MFKNAKLMGFAAVALCACGRDQAQISSAPMQIEEPVWTNNGFEQDSIGNTPTGWTVTTYQNTGISGTDAAPPTSLSMLNLGTAGAGVAETFVVGGSTMTQNDPDLGTGQAFRFPRFGARSVRVNYQNATNNGKNKNINMLRQTMTVGQADTDPTDGQIHVRVVLAPVLENPAHGFSQQPYFYVELTNVTRNASLYQAFNLAGQQSAPWNNTTGIVTGFPTQWLDWQMLDILAAPGSLAVGEQVQLTVVGSGCSLGGHFGRVYLDGVGASVPGPYTWATAPQLAKAGTALQYTVNYSNGDSNAAYGTSINFTIPANTTFASTSQASCSGVTAGNTGTLSCALGTLNPGATGAFTVTVNIASGATGTLHSGPYSITAVNASRLLGPAVNTRLVPASSGFADLVVTPLTTVTAANWGGNITYAFKVSNAGSTDLVAGDVLVNDAMPTQFASVAWSCAVTAGSATTACGASSGTGNIATHPKIATGGELTYTVNANIITGSGNATVFHDPNAQVVSALNDPNTYNNDAPMVLTLGTPRTLSLTKTQPGYGTITTYPNVLNCNTGCSAANGLAADGTSVQINAIAQNGGAFASWGGACTGTSPTCSVTMNGNQAVYANFSPAPNAGTAATVYVYSGNSQYAPVSTAYASPLKALVADANGTPVPNVSVTFGPSGGSGAGATLSPLTISTDANGIATSAPTANATNGNFTITATASGVSTPASFLLTNVGSPNSIVYIVGGNATTAQQAVINANFTSPPTVRVLDASGNPVPNATVGFVANGATANAVLNASSVTTNALGYASVGARANGTTGSYTLTASTLLGSGATGTVTFNLTNTAATAASIRTVSGTPQTTPTSGAFNLPLQVAVADSVGNPVPNATVTFTATGTGANAVLSSTTATTDTTGLASITATANGTSGSYTVTAAVSGVGTSAVFNLTNDGSQYITVQSGGNQLTTVGTAFGSPLVTLVTDRNGGPVSGATVTYTAPASGATAKFSGAASTTATTDANGMASAPAPTASSTAGSYTIAATTTAATAAANFGLTNGAGAATTVTATSGGGQSATVGAAFAASLVATVTDASGNGVSGVTVTFSAPASGATATLSSATAVTDASGRATISATAGTVASSSAYNVTATVGSSSATFALTNTTGSAATASIVSGNYQSTVANQNSTAPLVVKVVDTYGNPVSGLNVAFASSDSTKGVVTATVATDATGQASTTLTAKATRGLYTVSATPTGVTALTFNQSTITSNPTSLAISGGNVQSTAINTAFSTALKATVNGSQQYVYVTWTAPTTGASTNPNVFAAVTDNTGVATITPTAGAITGTYAVTASVYNYASTLAYNLTNNSGSASKITVSSGNNQSAPVNTQFGYMVAKVVDAGGNPISGVLVSFAGQGTTANANTITPTSGTSDSSGLVQVRPTANTVAGSYTVLATSTGLTSASFNLTNTPGSVAAVAVAAGNSQSATVNTTFGAPLSAQLVDAYGNAVSTAGVTVTFAPPGSGATASLSSLTATTNSAGQASVTPQAGTVTGTYTVSGSIPSGTSTANFGLTNAPGAAAGVSVVSGSPQSQAVTLAFANLVAQVVDSFGNAVPGAGVVVSYGAPTGTGVASATLAAPSATTVSNGQASLAANANSVTGAYTVTASIAGGSTNANFALTNTPGTAAKVSVSAGNGQTKPVNVAFDNPLVALVTDAYNNAVGSGTSVTFTTPASPNAILSAGSAATNGSGLASLTASAGLKVGDYNVIASVPSGTQNANFTLHNTVGPAAKVVAVSGTPQNTNVNTAFANLVGQVTDAYDNPVGAATTVNIAAPTGTNVASAVVPATASTNASGQISVPANANIVASSTAYNVVASVPSGSASATYVLTNRPGVPSQVSMASGDGQSQNANIAFTAPLVAKVTDQYGNPVSGIPVTFTAPGSGATALLASATATSDASGNASLSATAGTVVGSYSVSASVTGGSTTASFALTNTPAAAKAVAVVAGDPQSKTVGVAFDAPLVMQVRDGFGNAVGANVLVSFTPPSGSGVATASLASNANTDAQGRVSVTATAGTVVGSYTVGAAVSGGTSAATFHLTNVLGPLTTVVVVSGTPQNANVDTAFAAPLVAKVTDGYGNPAGSGNTVTFTTPVAEPNATLSATTASTNASGQVSITAQANHRAGSFSVVASIAGGSTAATFALTTQAGTANKVGVVSGDGQSAPVTVAFTNPLVAQVTDQYGNAVGANVTVNWSTPATSPNATLSVGAGPTDTNGQMSITATAGNKIGSYAVGAAISGGATAASFGLTNTAGAAAQIAAGLGNNQSAEANNTFALPLSAVVTDAQGNPKAGVTVTFTPPVGSPNATLSALTAVSDANGVAQVSAIAGTLVGTYSVAAQASGVATPTAFNLATIAAAASDLAITAGNDQNTRVTTAFAPVTVRVADAFNNAVANANVTIQPPASGATAALSATPGPTDANGQTTLSLNANTVAGSYTVNVATLGVATPAALRLTNNAGNANSVVVSLGNDQNVTVGSPLAALQVQVLDAYGNPVPNAAVSITLPASGATAVQAGTPAATDSTGKTSISLTAGTLPGAYTVAVGTAGVATPASFSVRNNVGPVASLTVEQGDSQSATVHGAFATTLEVLAADAYNNPVPGTPVVFTAPASGASTNPNVSTIVADGNGLASLSAVANTVAGSYSVVASSGSVPTVSLALTNTAGPVASLTSVSGSPQTTAVGTAFAAPLVMQAQDAYGNAVTGQSLQVSVPSSGASATLGGAATLTTDGQGQISTTVSANTILGSYSISVQAGPVSGTWALTNAAGPPTQMRRQSSDNLSLVINSPTPAPLVVRVSDAYDNPVSGVSVTFTPPSTGASLVASTTGFTTNAAGLAGLSGASNGTVGSYSINVAAAGVTPTVTFHLTNVSSGNATLVALSGDAQTTQVNTAYGQPLVVQAQDAGGGPIAAALVQFAASGAPVSLGATAMPTDANGQVSLSVNALATAGATQVTANWGNANVTFHLTAHAGPVVALVADASASTQAAAQGQAFAQRLGATAVDAWGNAVCCTAINFTATASGPTAQLSGAQVTTDANGYVSVQATAGSTPGSYPVTAVVQGSTVTASYTLTNLAGNAAQLHVVQGNDANTVVHGAFVAPLQVQLVDGSGSPLAGVPITFAAPTSGATASLSASVVSTDSNGYAQVSATANAVAGAYTVTVSTAGNAAPASFSLTNLAGNAAAALQDVASSPQTAQQNTTFAQPLAVTVLDADGNPVAGVTVTFTVPSSGASAALSAAGPFTTDANGRVQVTALANTTAGSYSVTATVTGITTPVTWTLTNSTDAPNVVASLSGTAQSTAVLTAFSPLVVAVYNSLGGPVPSAVVNFSGPASGAGAVFAASVIADANGVATLPLTANGVAGSYSVTATVDGGSAPLVFTLRNTEAAATQLLVSTSASPQSALVGHPFGVPLQVRVLDANNNPVVGAPVHFAVSGTDPNVLLSASDVLTDAQGYAQVVAIAGATAGAVTVNISVANTALSATATLTNVDAAPDTLALISGTGQNVIATRLLTAPLIFALRTADGLPAVGVAITLTASPSGLVLAHNTLTTDINGQISVVVTAGSVPGTYTVTASTPAAAAPASATLTVQNLPTQTTLALASTNLDPGQTIQASATVTASETPQGQVAFYVDGTRITASPVDSSGHATANFGTPVPGKHTVGATFVPQVPFDASQSGVVDIAITDWVISGGGCSAGGAGWMGLVYLVWVLGGRLKMRKRTSI